MKNPALLLLLLIASCGTTSFAQTCKSNQYDMLAWMAPQFATANGHWNMVYPTTGTFYWVKGSNGYPWDVDTFDANYVYQSITEEDWNNASTYKQFVSAIPWMPRCINVPTASGKLSSITLTPEQSTFNIHSSCSSYTTQNLNYVVNEIWGPYNESFGDSTTEPTLVLSYRYACDSSYSNCMYKETFALQENAGLVQWTLYQLDGGKYVQQNQTTHSETLQAGSVMPVHPCW